MDRDEMRAAISITVSICVFIFFVGVLWFLMNIMAYKSNIVEVKEIIDYEYNILQANNERVIEGYGEGHFSRSGGSFYLEITDDEYLSFYYKTNDGVIKKESLKFDFDIYEEDIEQARVVEYHELTRTEKCSLTGCRIDEERGDTYYRLFVPTGYFEDAPLKLY